MTCPHLKEVVMLYCDACHLRKMVSLHNLASASPCMGQDYRKCSLYQELTSRLGFGLAENQPAPAIPVFGREVTQS